MKVYHCTWSANAHKILQSGLINGKNGFVWLSSEPLDGADIKLGDGGDVRLLIEVPQQILHSYKVTVPNKQYDIFKIPAAVLNKCKISLHSTDFGGMTKAEFLEKLSNIKAKENTPGYRPPTDYSRWGTSQQMEEFLDFIAFYQASNPDVRFEVLP